MQTVYVGMSGGVDSSVTAALLLEQDYKVTGVYMKNWAQDLPGLDCPWREDLTDAKRVAVQLGIPFKIYDFQKEYKQKVVDYMVREYKAGLTPNPDIVCNQEIKFKLFLETALQDGADMIATGHYARIVKSKKQKAKREEAKQPNNQKVSYELHKAADKNKDQTYFLYRVPEDTLAKALFPLGGMTKPEVRKKAKKLGLITAEKKDSVGICFVGKVGIKDFLSNFVSSQPGDIIEQEGTAVVGRHDGALYYTIGQRHGLNVGGGLPYYVTGKDIAKNEVYVSTDLNDPHLWQRQFSLTSLHWINSNYQLPIANYQLSVRVRHQGALAKVKQLRQVGAHRFQVELHDELRGLAPGQSAVLYQDTLCLGGGIIA